MTITRRQYVEDLAEAEKRGMVKYARNLAKALGESAIGFTPKDFVLRSVAQGLLVEASRIESGEVTLP